MTPVRAYDPSRISTAGMVIAQAHDDIAEALAHLDAEVSTLRSGWNGEATDAYSRAQALWTTRQAEMNRILELASTAAGNSAARYSRGRAKIAARWS